MFNLRKKILLSEYLKIIICEKSIAIKKNCQNFYVENNINSNFIYNFQQQLNFLY